jgi:phage gp29-like protein
MSYIEPTDRIQVDWTADRVRTAERLADAGNLRLAADLCETLQNDDRVSASIALRSRGGLALFSGFERSAARSRDALQAERFLEAEEDWYTLVPDNELALLDSWAILLGVGLAQNVWPKEVNSAGRLVSTLETWSPRNLRRDHNGRWLVRTADSGDVEVAPGDGQWVLHTPSGAKRPWATAPWRAVVRWWLLIQYARQDIARYGERAAGIMVATPPAPVMGGKVDDVERKVQKRQLAEDLTELGRNGSIVLPAGWDAKLVQATANTHRVYIDQCALAQAGIAIALRGQTLTTEVKGGSFAAATVHASVEHTLLTADANARAVTLHDQVLVPWARYNLRGGAAAAPWPVWDTTPPEDLLATSQAWNGALDAMTKATQLGLEIDEQEVARRFRMPLRKRADAAPRDTTNAK